MLRLSMNLNMHTLEVLNGNSLTADQWPFAPAD